MRVLNHGLKSLYRRPVKTIMLFVIFFIVFNLVFTGLIIDNSIDESKTYIRNQMGGVVEYRMDLTQAMAQRNMNLPSLSLNVAERIANNRYVQNYFVTESANANSDQIEPVETQQTLGGFVRGASDFTLTGSNQAAPLDLVMGNITLVEGSLFSEQNLANGDRVVLVSQDVAQKNDLRVGDVISLAGAGMGAMMPGQRGGMPDNTTGTALDYEVVGIYGAVEDEFSTNTLFAPLTVIDAINNRGDRDETNASIVYFLDSPDYIEAFKAEVSPYITSEYHILYSNDDAYESLTKPLNLLSFIAFLLIWVVFIAGAAIVLAIVTIFVRDRKFEIGLLLSSGEGKMRIVSQYIFEIVLVAIISFGISVGSSTIASKSVSNWIVEHQLLAESSLIAGTSNSTPDINFPQRIQMGRNTTSIYGDVDMESVAAEFDVALNPSVMGNLFMISLLLVLAGSSIPLVVILSYKPKRILQDY